MLAGAFLAFTATAQIQYSNEFWISTNATGNLYPTGGTLASPLDGSSQANFDTNMERLPANSTIHILAGTYQTFGDEAWIVKTGQKIVGSGVDITTVQLATNAPEEGDGTYTIASEGVLIGGYLPVTNAVVSDLTVDCNWTPANGSITRNGVALDGTENSVLRVKVKNQSFDTNYSSEAWGIALDNSGLLASVGNVIEGCEIDPLIYGHSISALSFNGGPTDIVSGLIKNNRVFLSPDPVGAQVAINGSGESGVVIEGNYVDGADGAVYGDNGGCTNMIIAHNIFKNCFQGVTYTGYSNRGNITIDFNNFQLTPGAAAAIDLWTGNPPGILTNVVVFGNTISVYGPGPAGTAAIYAATNIVSLIFADNTIDPLIAANQATTTFFVPGGNVHMYNNYDTLGNYIPCLNIPELGGVPVSPLGLNLISSSQPSTVLTNLGLPSNPTAVVTNNQSGVTLNGTFSGNGSGLTNIPATSLTGSLSTSSLPFYIRAGSTNFGEGSTAPITFSTPVPDTNYAVSVTAYAVWGGGSGPTTVTCATKTTNGFTVQFTGGTVSSRVDYIVIKKQ